MENIEYRPIVLPKATLDLLLSSPPSNRADIIALYVFYYYTGIWQGTNQPHCSDKFVSGGKQNNLERKGLGWGRDKVARIRKILANTGLITILKQERPKGEGAGREFSKQYIKVNYYHGTDAVGKAELMAEIASLKDEINILESRVPPKTAAVVSAAPETGTNAYSNNKGNAYSNNSKTETSEKKDAFADNRHRIPPTPKEVSEYAESIDFVLSGEQFCDFYTQKSWLVGKAKMTDWQAAVRTWKGREPPAKDSLEYTSIETQEYVFNHWIEEGRIPRGTTFENWRQGKI